MAVKIFDKGLTGLRNIGVRNVQLLATTALFIATKYEEVFPEPLRKYLEMTLDSYKKH